MVSTRDVKAVKRYGLSYFIREQMELRGWTESEFSIISGFTLNEVQQMLCDKFHLAFDDALLLGLVFDSSANYWMNIDGRWANERGDGR